MLSKILKKTSFILYDLPFTEIKCYILIFYEIYKRLYKTMFPKYKKTSVIFYELPSTIEMRIKEDQYL